MRQRNGKNKYKNSGTRVVQPLTTPMIISQLGHEKKLKKIVPLRFYGNNAIKTGLVRDLIHPPECDPDIPG